MVGLEERERTLTAHLSGDLRKWVTCRESPPTSSRSEGSGTCLEWLLVRPILTASPDPSDLIEDQPASPCARATALPRQARRRVR
jgi:hypothetical protein